MENVIYLITDNPTGEEYLAVGFDGLMERLHTLYLNIDHEDIDITITGLTEDQVEEYLQSHINGDN